MGDYRSFVPLVRYTGMAQSEPSGALRFATAQEAMSAAREIMLQAGGIDSGASVSDDPVNAKFGDHGVETINAP